MCQAPSILERLASCKPPNARMHACSMTYSCLGRHSATTGANPCAGRALLQLRKFAPAQKAKGVTPPDGGRHLLAAHGEETAAGTRRACTAARSTGFQRRSSIMRCLQPPYTCIMVLTATDASRSSVRCQPASALLYTYMMKLSSACRLAAALCCCATCRPHPAAGGQGQLVESCEAAMTTR